MHNLCLLFIVSLACWLSSLSREIHEGIVCIKVMWRHSHSHISLVAWYMKWHVEFLKKKIKFRLWDTLWQSFWKIGPSNGKQKLVNVCEVGCCCSLPKQIDNLVTSRSLNLIFPRGKNKVLLGIVGVMAKIRSSWYHTCL